MLRAAKPHDLFENHLLRSLSAEDCASFCQTMQHIPLILGHVLYELGGPLDYVYFPTTCVVSCLYTMHDGSTAEMALAGNDGMAGIASFLGGARRRTGQSYRLEVMRSGFRLDHFKQSLHAAGGFNIFYCVIRRPS